MVIEKIRDRLTGYRFSLSEVLLVIAVFSKEVGTSRFLGVDFDFIGYPFFILYFILNFHKIVVSKATPHLLFAYLTFSSLFSILLLNLGYANFLKQLIPILLIFSVNFFIINKSDLPALFRLYVKVTYYTAIFGIIQVILSRFANVEILIKQHGRLDSISYEPSHYAAILLPAMIYCFFHFQSYRKYFFVMLLALILTFNLTGYMVFLTVISFAYINPVYIGLSIPFLYFFTFNVLQDFNENFYKRITDTVDVFSGQKMILGLTTSANGTTVSFYSNLMVALTSVRMNFLTGCGLGGHEEMYYREYSNSIFRFNYYYELNAKSGHSLSIRILSEFGLLGLFLYVYTIIKNLVLLDNGVYKSISLACLSHFLCKTLKLGGYIDYGTPFFFAMFILTHRAFRENRQNGEEEVVVAEPEEEDQPALA